VSNFGRWQTKESDMPRTTGALLLFILSAAIFAQGTRKQSKETTTLAQSVSPTIASLIAKAEAGDIQAMGQLRANYEYGLGVPQDLNEAMRWARKGAELGDANSQWVVGYYYANGLGVFRPDAVESVKWYRLAAVQGDCMAQFHLGQAYDEGVGVPQNFAEAVRWYSKAAMGNFAWAASWAQFKLGLCYALGQGVKEDPVEAYVWLCLSATYGDDIGPKAKEARDAIAKGLPPQALEAGQARARRLHEELLTRVGRK